LTIQFLDVKESRLLKLLKEDTIHIQQASMADASLARRQLFSRAFHPDETSCRRANW